MKKRMFLLGAVAVLLVILAVGTVLVKKPTASWEKDRKPEIISYSSTPHDWVDDYKDGRKEIRIGDITQGRASYDANTEQFKDGDFWTVFALDGIYNGSVFTGSYKESNITLMKIGLEMHPYDGIIEGVIVENIEDRENEKLTAYIFVDEDWKKNVPFTNIFFGGFYQYYKPFSFTEVSPGVYMDTVEDDPDRHDRNFAISSGGIAVGNIKEENIINNDIEGVTLMRLYS